MYEDYYNEHSFFRPSDDRDLATLHNSLKDCDYSNIINNSEIEVCINNGIFTLDTVFIDSEDKLKEFLIFIKV